MIWEAADLAPQHPVPVFGEVISECYGAGWYGKTTDEEADFYASYCGDGTSLEVGCGTGRLSIQLLKRGCKLYGIDGSAAMLSRLRSTIESTVADRFLQWDATRTPYPVRSGVFDVVLVPFSTFGLMHYGADNFEANSVLKEFTRILAPGGVALINDLRTQRFAEESSATTKLSVHTHLHPIHGEIEERQASIFQIVKSSLLPRQVIRKRTTTIVRIVDGEVLGEFTECIPVWDINDYPVLAHDAGMRYSGYETTTAFHELPSVTHVMRRE